MDFNTFFSDLLAPIILILFSTLFNAWFTYYRVKKSNKDIIEKIEEGDIGKDTAALDELYKTIKKYLEKRVKSGPVTLDLKLIAVAMTYSWEFIEEKIPLLLNQDEFSSVTINLQVAFVDHKYLSQKILKISNEGKDWAKTSKLNETKIPKYAKSMAEFFGNRFTCEFHTYRNLPHWHGWLVCEAQNELAGVAPTNENSTITHLFMGRTRWEHTYPKSGTRRIPPKMTVGQNEYRLFTDKTKHGISRIELFEQWHMYYYEIAFANIISEDNKRKRAKRLKE